MIININSGSSGWGNYVLYGTKEKPRDNSKVELLDGDISLGDYYSKNNKYEDSYYTVVLGFKGKPSKEVIEGAYNDFKEHFFKGLSEDEYHIDAVIHYDTDDTHIHARIPKQNLLTNTHLQLYYDKIDRPRKELIQDYISLKYGLEIARETNKEIVKEQSHEYINKWREEQGVQESFDFSRKKGKTKAEQQINSYISDLITSNMIEKQEDIRTVLEELDLEVIKFDRDRKKDFAYVTVQNASGKMRVKGEFYDREFFSYNAEDRRTQIESNKRIKENAEPISERFTRVQRELRKANEKRYSRVTELFRTARARANKQIKETTSKAIAINKQSARRKLEYNRELIKSTHNQNISNRSNVRDNNRDNINDNDKTTLSNTEREPRSTDNRSINGDKSRTVQQSSRILQKTTKSLQKMEEQSREPREKNRTVTSNEKSKQAINPRTERVASTTEQAERGQVREVYQGRAKEDIQRRGNRLQVGNDKGVQVNETSRADNYERDRTARRKRAETFRENRRTRIELYKSITKESKNLREQSERDSKRLPRNYSEYADRTRRTATRIREQEQENIRQSEYHISTTQSIANKIEALARFKQRISSYIKTAREYIIDHYNDCVKIVNEMKHNLDGTKEHFEETYEKEELSFTDLDKTEDIVELNKSFNEQKLFDKSKIIRKRTIP